MAIVKVTKENFEKEVIKSENKVLIDFWASWCGPCMMISPIVDEISEERKDIKVCKVNVDEEQELAATFSIQSIPTLFVMDKGKTVDSVIGVVGKNAILEMLG